MVLCSPMARQLTVDDLWNLAYFTGDPVTLTVGGGHDTVYQVRSQGLLYNLPTDLEELLTVCDTAGQP